MPLNAIDIKGDRYYVWGDRRYVSVTTVIDVLPKPFLQRWKDKRLIEDYRNHQDDVVGERPRGPVYLRDKKPADVLEYLKGKDESASASVGTLVHQYMESIAKGLALPEPTDEDLAGFYDQCNRFMDDYRPIIVESEVTVYSRTWGFAGTADMILEIGGRRYFCDIKSGRSIWPEVGLQLAGYRNTDFIGRPDGTEDAIPECDDRLGLVLHVRPDGYEPRTVGIGGHVWQTFLSALDVFEWTHGGGDGTIGGIHPIDD